MTKKRGFLIFVDKLRIIFIFWDTQISTLSIKINYSFINLLEAEDIKKILIFIDTNDYK